MKGENRLKILEFLEESSQLIEDMFFIFTLPYGTSFGKMEYLLNKKHRDREVQKNYREKQRFNDLLYHLSKDNLVTKTNKSGKFLIKLTAKGRKYLSGLQSIKSSTLPNNHFRPEDENVLKIVIFDIPETEKRKRAWLRAALKNLEFIMLQKSVWIGRLKLPQEFISAIETLNLSPYVEIFTISKAGSLKRLNI